MDVIEVSNLSYEYAGGIKALDGVSFKIEKGKKVAILGPNGAGKSTLLFHLAGLRFASEGEIKISGTVLTKQNAVQVRKKVGMVFQDSDDQIFCLTIWEDVAFGPTNMQLSEEEVRVRVERALEAVDMRGFESRAPHRLSQGQKKRVAIAGILAMEPEILLLDEPSANLDTNSEDRIIEIIKNLNAQGKTIVCATCDVDFASEWADEVMLLDRKVIAYGKVREMLSDAKVLKKAKLRPTKITEVFMALGAENPYPITISDAVENIEKIKKK